MPLRDACGIIDEQRLTQAGNRAFEIVVFPGVGHSLGGFLPAYWETLSDW